VKRHVNTASIQYKDNFIFDFESSRGFSKASKTLVIMMAIHITVSKTFIFLTEYSSTLIKNFLSLLSELIINNDRSASKNCLNFSLHPDFSNSSLVYNYIGTTLFFNLVPIPAPIN